nr:Chain B, Tristetraprolin
APRRLPIFNRISVSE